MLFTGVSKQQERESTKRRGHPSKAICLVAALAIAAMIPMSTWADNDQSKEDFETFTVNVALDGTTLVVNHVDPTQPPTAQLRGDILVIHGTIYPGGTLPSGFANNDPTNILPQICHPIDSFKSS
jgi:hypothetical protein